MSLPSLDIAIVTHGPEGLKKVEKMLMPPMVGVTYVVSWQMPGEAPSLDVSDKRKDVKVIILDEPGISRNRNNAIENCEADIILFSDDDLIYNPESIDKLRKAFKDNPDMDMGLFKVDFLNKKQYPIEECEINTDFPKGYFVTSMEIAVRRTSVGSLRFYPELGLGSSSMDCGEEEMFVLSALHRGWKCKFFPITICSHPGATTGDKVSPSICRAMGFIVTLKYPVSFLPRLFLKAMRMTKRTDYPFFKALYHLSSGAVKAIWGFRKIPSKFRW